MRENMFEVNMEMDNHVPIKYGRNPTPNLTVHGCRFSIIKTVDSPNEGSGREKDNGSTVMIHPSWGKHKTLKMLDTTVVIAQVQLRPNKGL